MQPGKVGINRGHGIKDRHGKWCFAGTAWIFLAAGLLAQMAGCGQLGAMGQGGQMAAGTLTQMAGCGQLGIAGGKQGCTSLFGMLGFLPEVLQGTAAIPPAPMCIIVSEDTVWGESRVLENGELIVEPGVTLEVKGELEIHGKVFIHGEGKVLRGSRNAKIMVGSNAHLTVKSITMEGVSAESPYSIINVLGGTVTLDDGAYFRNFIKTTYAGSATGGSGGGWLYHAGSEVYMYGGKFIPASNEPSSRARADIWRMPRGANTPPLGGGKNKPGHAP